MDSGSCQAENALVVIRGDGVLVGRDITRYLLTFSAAKDQHQTFFSRHFIGNSVHQPLARIAAIAGQDIDMHRGEAIRAMVAAASLTGRYHSPTRGAGKRDIYMSEIRILHV